MSCFVFSVRSQEPIISVDVEDMEEAVYETEYGQNKKKYKQFYYSIGSSWDYEGTSMVLQNKPHQSIEASSGYQGKLKLNNTFALVAANSLSVKNIRLSDQGEIWEDFDDFDKERIFSYQYGLFLAFRINFDARRRGNFVGFFVDLGFYGNLNFIRRHRAITKPDGFFKLATSKSFINNPGYLEWYEAGPELRIAKGNLGFYTRYRLTSLLLNDRAGGRMLPRLSSGLLLYFN